MKLVDKYKGIDRISQKVRNVLLVIMLIPFSIVVEAGALKLDLEGCHADSNNGYFGTYVEDIHTNHPDFKMYFCNDNSYTDGNLGSWAELDMVPHHITFSNTTGSDQNFTFKVGGDYKDTSHADVIGWDYITELTLDEEATLAINNGDQSKVDACRNIGSLSSQEVLISGDESEIFRQVTVEGYPNNLTCVAIYNMRLAIGSSRYTGSSLQSRLISVASSENVGDQTLPTSDILSIIFSKTMTAVQNATTEWSITKSGQGPVRFGNTCEDNASLSQDIDIIVTWEKGDVSLSGQVNVTSVIKASNKALRPLSIEVIDQLYNGTELLETFSCGPVQLNPTTLDQTICTNTVSIDESKSDDLHDKAIATVTDPDYPEANIGTKEATATASVDTSEIITNTSVIINDHEWLDGELSLSYAVKSFEGADGGFDNYVMPLLTREDINWTSVSQDTSGSVTFKKSINVIKGETVTDSIIYDTAHLHGSDGLFRDSGDPLSINIYATPKVKLTIVKNVDADIIAENKALDFNFTIQQGGVVVREATITVPAGAPSAYTTVDLLPAGDYVITEISPSGYQAVKNPQQITLDPSSQCNSTIVFNNELAGRPAVKVTKVTHPGIIGGVDQGAGWEMKLLKQNTSNPEEWVEVASGITIGTGQELILKEENTLLEGNYTIVEVIDGHDGWYNVGQQGCAFYYDGGDHPDFSCTFGNAKFGKIIINKQIESNNVYSTVFTFDVNGSTTLQLGDDQSETYENLKAYPNAPVSYYVTESIEPGFILNGLVCDEYYAPGIPAISNTDVNLDTRTARIKLDPGETVECTFTNKVVENASLVIEKSTNGEDADVAPGPSILVGDAVNWTYVVTNTGDVALSNVNVTDNRGITVSCLSTTLAVGETMTCTASGIATVGQYSNIGTAMAETPEGASVSDDDTSYYFGVLPNVEYPSIVIEKSTNGEDADVAPGPSILVGDEVNWSYVIYNNGNVALSNIDVVDDQGVSISCPSTTLAAGETMICTASGIAIAGQYSNIGTATAETPEGASVSDDDTSYYFGVLPIVEHPSITIEKRTNGDHAVVAPGPDIFVGDVVNWTYVVTNTGDVALSNVNVTDNRGVTVSCPSTTLAVGETMTCTASGIATVGQYLNIGTATAETPEGASVSDDDPSYYFGVNEIVNPDQNQTDCPCDDIKSDSSTAFNTVSSILMIIMTLILGFFFVRKEELNTNQK